MKNKKIKITELKLDDFISIIPSKELERILEYRCGKKEVKHFWNYMNGQTVAMLEQQSGIFVIDLIRFLKYRKRGLWKD